MMKRLCLSLLMLMVAGSLVMAEDAQPQLAYRILGDYLKKQESGDSHKIAGSIMMGTGLGLGVLAAGAYVFGDEVTAYLNDGSPWDEQTKYIVSGSLLAGGILTAGIGIGVYNSVPEDPYAEYSEVFEEEDPLVQEAMAAAALRNISDEGKENRMRTGFMDLAVPLITLGVTGVVNVSTGKDWYTDFEHVGRWQLFSIAGGISTLCFQKSEGEKLYEKYRAAREAIFVGDR